MATHAEDALPILTFGDGLTEIQQGLQHILGKVRYTRSFSVCHTAAARLPPNRNLWRTYNIEVRNPEDTFFPYRIDYVANRHQNDAENSDYNQAGLPQYFVSLVDDLNKIPHREMLERRPSPLNDSIATDPNEAGYRDRLPPLGSALEAKAWKLKRKSSAITEPPPKDASRETRTYARCCSLAVGRAARAFRSSAWNSQSISSPCCWGIPDQRKDNARRLVTAGSQTRHRHQQTSRFALAPAIP